MAETPSPASSPATATTGPSARAPWYALHPRHLRFSTGTRIFLAITLPLLLLYSVSVKPLWQFGWRTRLYCFTEMLPVTAASGARLPAGAWVRSREIHVYGAPGVSDRAVNEAYSGMQNLVEELGLAITVRRMIPPPDALASLRAATARREGETSFDFDRFAARRLDDRAGRYAEMVVVNATFTDPHWAWGLSMFAYGLSVLREDSASIDLGRHEGAHLLGYDKHDDFPLYVFGYPESWLPSERNTLMMLKPTDSSALSPRARDALLAFWQGVAAREHLTVFTAKPPTAGTGHHPAHAR